MDPYADYLAALHARLNTPAAVVDAAVRRVTARSIETRLRIVGGEANEVYEIRFAEAPALIVRISRDAHKAFEQERWAIDQCRALGVPAPRVLSIEHLSSEAGPLDLCIQERLAGCVLTPAVAAALPRDDARRIVVSLGGYLSRIHSIRTDGHDYLDGAGRGAPPPDLAGWSVADQATLLDLAVASGFPRDAMQHILDISTAHARPTDEPRLVHNDMRAHHVMVDGDCITGIIDWGEVSGEAPIQDFVHWDYWDGARLPTAWLGEGYGHTPFLAEDFTFRLALGRLDYGLCVLQWYQQKGYSAGVADAKTKLLRDLAVVSRYLP